VHVSVAGGLHRGIERARDLGCGCCQLFSHNPRGWSTPPLAPGERDLFLAARSAHDISPVFVHAPYLLNISSPDDALRTRSALALRTEMRRAADLGAEYVVLHTGTAHDGGGIERAAQSIREALAGETLAAGLLIENTSGKRGDVTPRVADLAGIIALCEGLVAGVCIDTCHAHAAGYDLATDDGRNRLLGEIAGELAPGAVRLIHLNDSRGPAGSGLDRHAHVGEGTIGTASLRAFLTSPLLAEVPIVLETPKETDEDDVRNLRAARELI
jgi:deoxyribonuclease-4